MSRRRRLRLARSAVLLVATVVTVTMVALLVTGRPSAGESAASSGTGMASMSMGAGGSDLAGTGAAGAGAGSLPASGPRPLGALPGMPPLLDPTDVYAADRPDALSAAVARRPARVYVPNNGSNTVSVIDPKTYKVIRTVRVGR